MKNIFLLLTFFTAGVLSTVWYFSQKKEEKPPEPPRPEMALAASPSPKASPPIRYNLPTAPPPPSNSPSASSSPSAVVLPSPETHSQPMAKRQEFNTFMKEKVKGRKGTPLHYNTILQQSFFESGAVVFGKVLYSGASNPTPLKMQADPNCGAQVGEEKPVAEDIVASQGGLQNVLVYVKNDLPELNLPEVYLPKVTLMQSGCIYRPHVLGLMVNQPLEIVNQDQTLHNVHAMPKINPGFNLGQTTNVPLEKKFNQPEVPIKLKCDIHGWMSSYIGVFSHPYFSVSNELGSFVLRGLQPGTYTIESWHEKFGTKSQKITLRNPKEILHLDFQY